MLFEIILSTNVCIGQLAYPVMMLFGHRHLNNVSHNKTHSLIGKPHLVIVVSYGSNFTFK